MATIVGVCFKECGRAYSFDPGKEIFSYGEEVIVETSQGLTFGKIAFGNREVEESELSAPLKPVIRRATEEDIKRVAEMKKKEEEGMKVCQERIEHHKLEMRLVEVECSFDNSKMLFYFTADGRVDFRELVKDLASRFHMRIELRQIGVRDEAKLLGGLGICGQPFCCKQFLPDFEPVSIKMAKEQGLSLNPAKISGCCGRLMCCLKYEEDVYEELSKITPKVGAFVKTAEGTGNVVESNTLSGKLKVRLTKSQDAPPKTFTRDEVTLLKEGKGRIPKNPQPEEPDEE